MGTYWPQEPTATLPSAGAAVGSVARGASAPTEGGEGWGAYCGGRLQLVVVEYLKSGVSYGQSCYRPVIGNHT